MDLVLQLQRTMDRVVGIESLHDDVTGGRGGVRILFLFIIIL